jgi:hypothetical protein
MSVLERHPELKEPMEQIEFRAPQEPPRDDDKPVRWIAWTFSILVVAAAAIAALIIASETTEPFDSIYENGSPLAYGAVHESGIDVGFRWVGESDMTLEEFEMFAAYEATTGEADRVLIQSVGPVSPRTFTPEELAALQASVGEADLKYLQMASTG